MLHAFLPIYDVDCKWWYFKIYTFQKYIKNQSLRIAKWNKLKYVQIHFLLSQGEFYFKNAQNVIFFLNFWIQFSCSHHLSVANKGEYNLSFLLMKTYS